MVAIFFLSKGILYFLQIFDFGLDYPKTEDQYNSLSGVSYQIWTKMQFSSLVSNPNQCTKKF